MEFTKENARELRIGNWINIIGLVPTQATADHIKLIAEGDDQYDAIPLTEEWLKKFSLKFHIGTMRWVKGTLDGPSYEYDIELYEQKSGILKYRKAELKFVHQLQNLYFALTGEELTIKE
jgi:hypothetical protein